ncbi:gliding motility protein GldB-related protein [Psychroserpens luteolus]|uniref:gliding motility protein GldB-related protein n=1 Tax=Psychroserpens luteolus TaxID=2855840 RepID=UPI001E4DE9AB|nr:DUF2268 domain-containing putative Zn-dependent protease [Psychroserpens luteolus]MCD2260897.1 DUF2268 domain-containing protein [Psychroserpens luteolus]
MTRVTKAVFYLFMMLCFINCSNSAVKNSATLTLHFEDIDNFWKAYDKAKCFKSHADRAEVLQEEYIDKGSKGLQLLIKKDQLTAGDFATFIKDTIFYNSIRSVTLNAKNDSEKIRKHLKSFERTYPKAQFNDIYFVVGQFKRAGTVIENTMIIEIEKNAVSSMTNSEFLFNKDQLKSLNDYASLVPLIVHEQVHVNQKNINTKNLLSKSICEGSADFLMYLQTGKFPLTLQETYSYGESNEAELWIKFQTDLDRNFKHIKTNWFYNYDRDDIPPDLGYFMGFKICETYYNKSENKEKAIEFMLDINNSEKLLELSGYKGGL